jgi:hypothetical protein
MRRTIALAGAAIALAAAAAAYSGYWFITAERLRSGVERWGAARQAEGRDLHWTAVTSEGFPFCFRLRITGAVLDGARPLPFTAATPVLVGEAQPWNLRRWELRAPDGAQVTMPVEGTTLAAAVVDGTLVPPMPGGGMAVTIRAHDVVASGNAALRIGEAELQLGLPEHAPADHRDAALDAALHLANVTLTHPLPPLGNTVDSLSVAGTLKGTLPQGPLREALAAWRQDGGTVELEDGSIQWGALALSATGTLALDETLQPIGALTATVVDQNAVIDAAVAQGNMRAGDGDLAKIVLGLMAKPGADGKPRLTVPLRVQNRRLYLGPAQLATLPRFTWE